MAIAGRRVRRSAQVAAAVAGGAAVSPRERRVAWADALVADAGGLLVGELPRCAQERQDGGQLAGGAVGQVAAESCAQDAPDVAGDVTAYPLYRRGRYVTPCSTRMSDADPPSPAKAGSTCATG